MNIYFSESSNINEWIEWHLTLRGWERGSEKREDSPLEKKVNPPIDRILTEKDKLEASTNIKVNQEAENEKILCPHCLRTATNGIKCKGICVADNDY